MKTDETKNNLNNSTDVSGDTEFIVPEPDGVNSGYPIEEEDVMNREDDEDTTFSTESLNYKLRKKSPTTQSTRDMTDRDNFSGTKSGISIKAKLISSLAALTVIIIFIGMISYSSIRRVSYISNDIDKNYSSLAKISEQIKSTVYKIRDAEKDFLILEEQEALDRASRFTERLRNQILKAKNIGKSIDNREGIRLGGQYQKISDAVENYGSLFSQQVKDIKQARININKNYADLDNFKNRLVTEANSNHDLLKTLNENFWLDIEKRLKAKGQMAEEIQVLFIGNLLNKLEKDLLHIQVQVARYLTNEKKSNADAAKEYIKTAIDLTHRVYRESTDAKVRSQIEDIRKNLNIYSSFFTEVMENNSETASRKKEIDKKIIEQKRGLQNEGDNLIDLASELSNNSWNSISNQTSILSKVTNKSKSFIIILVIFGGLLGITVLIYIPRPILSSINQLLKGAKSVAAGNLSERMDVSSRDELGQLAQAFEHMRRNLVGLVDRIQRASVQISTSVNEIQAASNQQNSTANEQSTAINEFNATMSEIARTSANLAKITNQVSQNTTNINQWINDSNNKSSQILESMNAINSSTKLTSDRIKSLNDQMDNINDAVITISGIADQTTLLSLNAAIEANKAGELGKGFAVVSTEIRRLSDRSIDSASSITSMVRDIQRATENSVVAMDKSSEEIRIGIDYVKESTETLAGINNSMDQIQEQISEISLSSKDAAESSRQSQQTTSELLASSKMVSQASKQTSIAALELNAMANQLSDAVAAFKI